MFPFDLRRQPLSSIKAPFTLLDSHSAQITDDLYLRLTSLDKSLKTYPEPYICAIVYAPSFGAYCRALNSEIEKDDERIGIPPNELSFGGLNSYGQILAECKKLSPGKIIESATYRIAIDGAFVYRQIQLSIYRFYFRGKEPNDKELPFSIMKIID